MVASTARSRKTKGQTFQKEIVSKFRKKFLMDNLVESCFEGDIQANPMGQSGIDIKLSPKAEQFIPFDVEAKFHERLDIWSAIKQAETNAKPYRVPLVCFKRSNSKTYAVLELDKLLWLLE